MQYIVECKVDSSYLGGDIISSKELGYIIGMISITKDQISHEILIKSGDIYIFLNDIKNIVIESNELLEGNSFYLHNTFIMQDNRFPIQYNLFWVGKMATTRICEIGFNAGHSTFLMLLGRDEKTSLDFTIFDIGEHSYTKPSFHYIQEKFSHVKFEFIEGDSTIKMPEYINANSSLVGSYDIIHIDGGHSEHCIMNDMKHADILLKVDGILIIDDTQVAHIIKYIDIYISLQIKA